MAAPARQPRRGGPPQQPQQPQATTAERPRWLRIVCAIAYELRPFTLPTRHDLVQYYHSTRQTLRLLGSEGAALVRTVAGAAATHLTWRRVAAVGAYGGLQWAAARVEFGVVFFILAMLGLIFTVGLGEDSRRGRNGERLSPWSVFNQGMRSMLGTLDPAQFEAEIRNYGLEDGGLGEQLLLRRGAGANDAVAAAAGQQGQQQQQQQQQEGQQGGGGGPARKSGKKARRRFDKEERRRRRMGAAAGGAGGGQEEVWEDDWVSDED